MEKNVAFVSPKTKKKILELSNSHETNTLPCQGMPHLLLQMKGCEHDPAKLIQDYYWIKKKWHHHECSQFLNNNKNCDKCSIGWTSIRKQFFPNLFGSLPDLMDYLPDKTQLVQWFESYARSVENPYFPTVEKYISKLNILDN